MNAWLPQASYPEERERRGGGERDGERMVARRGGRGWTLAACFIHSSTRRPEDSPCGNFSDTSSFKFRKAKGSLGHAFTVCIHTENQNQVSFSPYSLHEISVLIELTLGHLRYRLTGMPPQPNSPTDGVFCARRRSLLLEAAPEGAVPCITE